MNFTDKTKYKQEKVWNHSGSSETQIIDRNIREQPMESGYHEYKTIQRHPNHRIKE